MDTLKFIEKAKKIYGENFDYSKVNYVNNNTKITIICPIHGEFWQKPLAHLQGQGCRKCYEKTIGVNRKLPLSEFISRANLIHNNKYDYSKVEYINTGTKVCIICPEHGEFWQTPNKHLVAKQGCPKCKQTHLERKAESLLKELGIKYEYEKMFNWLGLKKLDFYLPEYNIAIECQGEQHFHPVESYGGIKAFNKQVKRDIAKYNECKENSVNLLYIINEEFNNSNDKKFSGIYSKLYYMEEIKEYISSIKDKSIY